MIINILKFSSLILLSLVYHSTSMIYYCDSISSDSQFVLLDSVITSYQLKNECCKGTIDQCMNKNKDCMLAHRFYNFSCWMVMKESDFSKIIIQLDKRTKSFFNQTTYSILPSILPPAGNKNAPIKITAYVSANCSLCKKVCIPLFMAVTKGPIENKATLSLKPITTNISNMALIAASKMGKFWEYYLSLENEKRRLDEKILVSKARKIGLPTKKFKKMLYDEDKKEILRAYKKEALNNGAKVTPTIFINNRRYSSYKNPQWVIDLVEFKYEKMK